MAKSNAMKAAVTAATERQAREDADKQAAAGMTTDENTAQNNKELSSHVQRTHESGEMAATTKPVGDTDAHSTTDIVLLFDKEGKIIADSFQATLKVMSPAFAEVQQEQVDRTFFSTFTDMFRIATLISNEYGILPDYAELGSAWQAAQSPEDFAFDKSVLAPSQANETEGVLQPMTWQEIKARQDSGLKPLSGAQWTFFIETCERVLHGITYLHTMRDLGYQSQHTREDIWTVAKENEAKRQNNYKLQQEAEHYRKNERSKEALTKATETGGALDL